MLTLILGGARSGKSRYAQSLCGGAERVVYVAAAQTDGDEEMQRRVVRHRADRPPEWTTVEEPLDVPCVIREHGGVPGTVVLFDCVTVWLANLLWAAREMSETNRESFVLARVQDLVEAARDGKVIAVSNEVGGGIVPDTPLGREFRDLQGLSNQLLAAAAKRVVLVVAGLPLVIKDDRR